MTNEIENAKQLYADPEVIAPAHLVPGATVCLVSNPNKAYGVVDRHGPLVELESEHGRRFKVGYRALRWPEGRGGADA
ncbi:MULTISPECIES: hypothetical protein [Halorhodospira]|uniref:hypothetical protein n=1 Tax=Halorhodospira TaxID=85108 RepID=UPI001EE7DF43|nr:MULTISPECIES: hypothetical protein [Halorhodospira]MCG5528591.1 hypothetical protein [Halorhodospira halophila]MCG5543746.1 hypothetical protein [Halorhodospira sp. 9628]